MRASRLISTFLLFLPSCATAASEDRRAYILAHPHGWIEVTIADPFIPDVPSRLGSEEPWQVPESCTVKVSVNDEPFLSDRAYPIGEHALYRADTGFRFPVSVGATALRFSYQDCRVAENQVVDVRLDALILVEKDKTHEVVFDGQTLETREPRPSTVVTLEDVYEAITGTRSPAR